MKKELCHQKIYLRKSPSEPGCVTPRPASIIWMDGDCAALPPEYSRAPTPYNISIILMSCFDIKTY